MKIGEWYRQTGQTWKLITFLGLVAMCVVTSFFMVFAMMNGWRVRSGLAIASISLSAAALGWISIALKCPRCSGRPGWILLTRANSSVAFTSIVTLNRCPNCGSVGS